MLDSKAEARSLYHAPEITFDPGPPRDFSPLGAASVAVMLGSGKPEPTIHRSGPCGAIIANGQPYVIDAGEGVWRAIARAAVAHDFKLAEAFSPRRLNRIFLTHLHSDHTIGLPAFLLLPWTCGCDCETHVYGPNGTHRLIAGILDAYAGDIIERVEGPESKEPNGARAVSHEIEEPGFVYGDENVRVSAFHHPHLGFRQNFGYRFETAGRTFVWAGDGVQSEGFRQAMVGADVVFSDASPAAEEKEAALWRGHEGRVSLKDIGHIRVDILGRMAREAGARRLVIHHEQNYSQPFDPGLLAREASVAFGNPVISARDGDVF